jgi:hypothetical protein
LTVTLLAEREAAHEKEEGKRLEYHSAIKGVN